MKTCLVRISETQFKHNFFYFRKHIAPPEVVSYASSPVGKANSNSFFEKTNSAPVESATDEAAAADCCNWNAKVS
jgi:hypothetical protein